MHKNTLLAKNDAGTKIRTHNLPTGSLLRLVEFFLFFFRDLRRLEGDGFDLQLAQLVQGPGSDHQVDATDPGSWSSSHQCSFPCSQRLTLLLSSLKFVFILILQIKWCEVNSSDITLAHRRTSTFGRPPYPPPIGGPGALTPIVHIKCSSAPHTWGEGSGV